ncbi:MAG TPA: iron-containing alcohol dehydrogenase [Pyrinomonadaceae bacterium]|nr:iron-containing alcohol dehydrogenase [Pyrinomonadaceae bacterium]
MKEFDFQPRTRVVFGAGVIERLGELARELNFKRTLLVADHGMVASGHVDEAVAPLKKAGVEVVRFHDFEVNPDTRMVENGTAFVSGFNVDSIIGLGGGSSMDCAKGINFLLTNGGHMAEYRGYGKATKPMLPMIAIPTTAGTGSEAQSYALISDAETHVKMACGDPKAAFRVALLDPALTISQPRSITATSGYDAIAHAVETYVTLRRNPLSELFSLEAWRLLEPNYERVLNQPDNISARGAMQLGAFYAGVAIENSMLGATHACANPLTARYGTAHGAAIAMLLPTVVRWNQETGTDYHSLGEEPARRLEELAEIGGLRNNLRSIGINETDLPALAADAAEQWTGTFNPRPLDKHGAIEIYQCAY